MTVTRIDETGSEGPSDIPATCDLCGIRGLRGDWPDQGGIVPDSGGRLLCDDCAAVDAED